MKSLHKGSPKLHKGGKVAQSIELAQLAEKMDKLLEKQSISGWEKAKVIFSAITPIAVVIIGVYFTHASQQTQTELARLALVPDFMDALTGEDPAKKILAVRTITKILPEQGTEILEGVLEDTTDTNLQAAVLKQLAKNEVKALFSDDAVERKRAFQVLAKLGVDIYLKPLVDHTNLNLNNDNGVYNALLLIKRFAQKAQTPFNSEIIELAKKAKVNGDKTETLANEIILQLKP